MTSSGITIMEAYEKFLESDTWRNRGQTMVAFTPPENAQRELIENFDRYADKNEGERNDSDI